MLDDLLARLGAGSRLIVAEDDGAVAGFAAFSHGRLEQLYVAPERWGRGVGGMLHDDERLRLWTLEDSHRSRAFSERRGGRPDGRTRVVPYPPHPLDVGYTLDL